MGFHLQEDITYFVFLLCSVRIILPVLITYGIMWLIIP